MPVLEYYVNKINTNSYNDHKYLDLCFHDVKKFKENLIL